MTACLTDMCVMYARTLQLLNSMKILNNMQSVHELHIWNRACDSVSYGCCVSGVRASDSETNDIALTKSVFNGRNGVLHIHRHVPCRRTNDVCARMEMTEISLRIIIFHILPSLSDVSVFLSCCGARPAKIPTQTQWWIIVSAYRINFFGFSLPRTRSLILHFISRRCTTHRLQPTSWVTPNELCNQQNCNYCNTNFISEVNIR